ncbi:cytochrome P450 736A117-like [Lycium barbarum]|uniref:cytochrome P450 736A117-like n=1 Tax=Lycium barbarum TaxID=112863 RepID=UPI00293E8AE4|nr:cytochrome P450 736A117-like [Lycium barbarum]
MFCLSPSFLAAISSILFIAIIIKWFSHTKKTLPPSPWKLPIIGNLHQLGLYPHRSLQMLSKKYGHLIQLQLGTNPALVVTSANVAQEILKNHDLVFANRPKTTFHDKLLYGSKDMAFSKYGEYWRQVRGVCVHQLLSNTRVQSFGTVREEETLLMIKKIRDLSSVSLPSEFNLSDILRSFTSDVFCRIALGKKYSDGEIGKRFKFLLKEAVGLLGAFSMGSYIPWLRWVNRFNGLNKRVELVANEFDEFLQGMVEQHINESKGGEAEIADFVDILLEEFHRQDNAGLSNHTDTVKALILDMFVGGSDTTFALLEWSMTELLRNPKTLEKLQNEAREVAQGNSCITEDDVPKMPYLKAVIKESLRLHPPIPLIPRQSSQDIKVMGYDVAANTQVYFNVWALGRDPSLWQNPEEFQPERFFGTNIDVKGFNFELIPFGSGRRGCPGSQFALAVNELALANLVLNFNFALPDRPNTKDLDIAESTGLAVHKKYPLVVLATHCF